MPELPVALRAGLEALTSRAGEQRLAASVTHLMGEYRSGRPARAPILASDHDVTAYAAYRMPATFSAVRSAFGQLVAAYPEFAPRSLTDVGGGTGAASWAAAEVFPSLASVTVLDQVEGALAVGRTLAATAEPALRGATWQRWQAGDAVPAADLVTVSYVLGELPDSAQASLLDQAVRAATLVLVIEPGTPAGYARVLRARETMRERGMTVVAPCPHQLACPLAGTTDWCHFAARVNRSALHRRLKNAELSHEDEKFSFVAATTAPVGPAAAARVLRHPQFRKGMVTMQLCRASGTVTPQIVSKRDGQLYRAARDVEWGDAWPPPPDAR